MHRFVLETLRAFASEDLTHQVVEAALHAAREIDVPEEGERLRRFVERHLVDAVEKTLGAEVSDAVVEALRPVARMFPGEAEKSRVRPRGGGETAQPARPKAEAKEKKPSLRWSASPASTPTEPPEPGGAAERAESGERATATPPGLALPMIILTTRDAEREAEIRRWLGGSAALVVARDAVHLLECVEVAMNLAPVLLIDCVAPAVQLPTLLMIGDDLPKGATIVLWGVAEDETYDEFALDHGAARFIRCSPEATARDVGTLLTPFIHR